MAFLAPTLTGWLLPLYEGALLTARLRDALPVSLISTEERPLGVFGADASAKVEAALRDAGVQFITGHRLDVARGAVLVSGATIAADRIVSLPLIRGPRIAGVPETGPYGLIPVDEYGRVIGLSAAYAIGDATDFPIKQGGLAAQQADAAALHVAMRHGAHVQLAPFRPVLRASLITGAGDPILLGTDELPVPGKIPGRFLGAYLAATPV